MIWFWIIYVCGLLLNLICLVYMMYDDTEHDSLEITLGEILLSIFMLLLSWIGSYYLIKHIIQEYDFFDKPIIKIKPRKE